MLKAIPVYERHFLPKKSNADIFYLLTAETSITDRSAAVVQNRLDLNRVTGIRRNAIIKCNEQYNGAELRQKESTFEREEKTLLML